MRTAAPRWLAMWWVGLALGIVMMAPGLLERIEIEGSNDTYELALASSDLHRLLRSEVDPDPVYDRLIAAGLKSVAVEMQTLGEVEVAGDVAVFTDADLRGLAAISGVEPPDETPNGAIYLAGEDDRVAAIVERLTRADPAVEVEAITIDGRELQRVRGVSDPETALLGFDDALVADLADRGLAVIARLPHDPPSADFAIAELERLDSQFGIDRVLFTGDAVPFDDDPDEAVRLADWMNDRQLSLLTIELLEQARLGIYLDRIDRVIRLHGLNMEEVPDPAQAVDRSVRAVKERNIRVILLRPAETAQPAPSIDLLSRVMAGTVEAMPSGFRTGAAAPIGPLTAGPLVTAGAFVASVSLVAGLGAMLAAWAAALGIAGVALLGLAILVTGSSLLADVLRLGVAVTASVLALYVARPRMRLARATLEYGKAALVVFAGGLTISGLAHGTEFLTASRDFWGVKALLIGPPLAAAGVAAYLSLRRPGWRDAVPLLRRPIEAWQVVALGVIAAAGWYLLLRSGNTGAASDVELVVRQELEDFLYVRPRTKEFLIGFPALLLGIFAAARTPHGWWLYVVAAIGTSSAIDTFAHFHAPLALSLLRTAYAVAFGYVIGALAVGFVAAAGSAARRLGLSLPER